MTLDLKSDKKNKWSPDYGFLFKISWSEPIKKIKRDPDKRNNKFLTSIFTY